jgi:hypothetical protein
MAAMTRLTSVQGTFRARVVAARLQAEGLDVELRGTDDGPYAATVGELARVDVFVRDDQLRDASVVLLGAEIDDALEPSDPAAAARNRRLRWIAVVALVALAGAPVLRLLELATR